MREIKFRGKRMRPSDKWAYGHLVEQDCIAIEIATEIDHELFYPRIGVTVYPETVGQYTGEQDAEHTDIYEGDIIYFLYEDKCEQGGQGVCVGVVTFENGMFVVKDPNFDYEAKGEQPETLHEWLKDHYCLVKGNIHES